MKYKDFCGYKYGFDKIEGYSIIPNKKIEQPSSFFKYYALSKNSVDALTNMFVYATHPNLFNDTFDCNEKLIAFETWEDVKHLLNPIHDNPEDYFYCLKDAQFFCREVYKVILYRKLGLLSLTTRPDNYQMWALYAENNGFCLEFDIDKFPFRHFGPFPMNYTANIPGPVSISKYGGEISMLIQSNVKNEWWKYEDEWRLYIPNPIGLDMESFGSEYQIKEHNNGDEHDRKFRYSIEALKSVILGPKFFYKLIPNAISSFEIDVVCHQKTNSLELDVLDFLANITEKRPLIIKWANLSDFSSYNFIPIEILKYSDRKFRIYKKQTR